MSIFDQILGQISSNVDIKNLAAKVGIDPTMAESAIAALAAGHAAPGDTVETAAANTGIDSGILQQIVGHIGGDDFIFVMPVEQAQDTCAEVVQTFDALVPFQYSEQDRRAGYYFGKDRRGQLHKVPLMTVSIGVVTNERRKFAHAAQVSELATEMKSYAKTLPGSVFTIDRRGDTHEGELPQVHKSNAAGVGEEN